MAKGGNPHIIGEKLILQAEKEIVITVQERRLARK
jgi:hypothetical protein